MLTITDNHKNRTLETASRKHNRISFKKRAKGFTHIEMENVKTQNKKYYYIFD